MKRTSFTDLDHTVPSNPDRISPTGQTYVRTFRRSIISRADEFRFVRPNEFHASAACLSVYERGNGQVDSRSRPRYAKRNVLPTRSQHRLRSWQGQRPAIWLANHVYRPPSLFSPFSLSLALSLPSFPLSRALHTRSLPPSAFAVSSDVMFFQQRDDRFANEAGNVGDRGTDGEFSRGCRRELRRARGLRSLEPRL